MSLNMPVHGGLDTVTGSKYLLDAAGERVLLDCGLFQGFKQLRPRNWAPLPVDPNADDVVILTRAHIDHSGYLPVWSRTVSRARSCAPRQRARCARF